MDILVAPKLKKYKMIGLAFGGGGARGFALIGVIKAFEEEGLKFDYIAGTSIGSIMGAMYSYGLPSAKIEELATSVRIKDIRKSKIPLVPSPTDAIEDCEE